MVTWRWKTREEYLADIQRAEAEMYPEGVPLSKYSEYQQWRRDHLPPSMRREWYGTEPEGIPLSEYTRRAAEDEKWWREKFPPKSPFDSAEPMGPAPLPPELGGVPYEPGTAPDDQVYPLQPPPLPPQLYDGPPPEPMGDPIPDPPLQPPHLPPELGGVPPEPGTEPQPPMQSTPGRPLGVGTNPAGWSGWLVPGLVALGIGAGGIAIQQTNDDGRDDTAPAASVTVVDTAEIGLPDTGPVVTVDDSAPESTPSTPGGGSTPSILGIPGRYIITEDPNAFSPGVPDGLDPLGCAGRRVPAEIEVALVPVDRIGLTYADEPGGEAFEHVGVIDAENRFTIDYPDASGRNIEGQFVLSGSSIEIRDGRIYSGNCTFGFTGTRG